MTPTRSAAATKSLCECHGGLRLAGRTRRVAPVHDVLARCGRRLGHRLGPLQRLVEIERARRPAVHDQHLAQPRTSLADRQHARGHLGLDDGDPGAAIVEEERVLLRTHQRVDGDGDGAQLGGAPEGRGKSGRVVQREQGPLLQFEPGLGQGAGGVGHTVGDLTVGDVRPAARKAAGRLGPGHVTIDEVGGGIELLGQRFHRRKLTLRAPSKIFRPHRKLCDPGKIMRYRTLPRALRPDSLHAWRGVVLAWHPRPRAGWGRGRPLHVEARRQALREAGRSAGFSPVDRPEHSASSTRPPAPARSGPAFGDRDPQPRRLPRAPGRLVNAVPATSISSRSNPTARCSAPPAATRGCGGHRRRRRAPVVESGNPPAAHYGIDRAAGGPPSPC